MSVEHECGVRYAVPGGFHDDHCLEDVQRRAIAHGAEILDASVAAMNEEIAALRAEVERLKAVAEGHKEFADTALNALDLAEAEVERLKGEVAHAAWETAVMMREREIKREIKGRREVIEAVLGLSWYGEFREAEIDARLTALFRERGWMEDGE